MAGQGAKVAKLTLVITLSAAAGASGLYVFSVNAVKVGDGGIVDNSGDKSITFGSGKVVGAATRELLSSMGTTIITPMLAERTQERAERMAERAAQLAIAETTAKEQRLQAEKVAAEQRLQATEQARFHKEETVEKAGKEVDKAKEEKEKAVGVAKAISWVLAGGFAVVAVVLAKK